MLSYEFQMESSARENSTHGLVGEVNLMKRNLLQLKSFTLIELLVVIGIIAILASMLLPALNQARDVAKTINCASRLKQHSLAFASYADSFDSMIPPVRYGTGADTVYWTKMFFDLKLLPMIMFSCPGRQAGTDYYMTQWRQQPSLSSISVNLQQFSEYGINQILANYASANAPAKLNRLRNPSLLILLAESTFSDRNRGYSYVEPSYGSSAYVIWPVHSNGYISNILYVDGHVEKLKSTARFEAGCQSLYAGSLKVQDNGIPWYNK